MSVEMEIDMREFQEALRSYLAMTQKTIPSALNKKMFFIARGAHRETPISDRSKIEAELGVVAYKVSLRKKTGKYARRKAVIGGTRLIYAIINARRGRDGKRGLYGKEMRDAARRLLSRRFRGIGTEKAGWLGAIRRLGSATGIPSTGGMQVKGKSTASIAKQGVSPEVSIEYNLNSYDTHHRQSIDARTIAGLQKSYNDEAKSMRDYFYGELQKDADKVNGR